MQVACYEKNKLGRIDLYLDKSTLSFVDVVILFSIKGTNSALDSISILNARALSLPTLLRTKFRVENQVLHS